jgi:hypothetical protein
VEELKVIEGARVHYLLPEIRVGALAVDLRHILDGSYGNRIDEMSFDLGVSEETLVGFLNGAMPNEERIAKRMGILAYQGRARFLETYVNDKFGWEPIEKIPQGMRDLIRLGREKMASLFGGRFPRDGFETVGGWKSGGHRKNPIHRILADGKAKFGGRYTIVNLIADFRMFLLNVERTADERLQHVPESAEVTRAIYKAIAHVNGWMPLEEIPESMRDLIKLGREKMIELFGGKFTAIGFETVDGWRSVLLQGSPIPQILADGNARISPNNPAQKLFEDFRMLLLNLERTDDGKVRHVSERPEVTEAINKAIAHINGWKPLEEIPEGMRDLIRLGREKMASLFGGRFPRKGFETADGRKSQDIYKQPIPHILADGNVSISPNNPVQKLFENFRMLLLNLERTEDGKFRYVPERPEVAEAISKAIAHINDWKPLEEIPESMRDLIRLGREKMIELFGGRFTARGFETADGWKSGKLQNSPIPQLLTDGHLTYSSTNTPNIFWDKYVNLLFRIERTPDGKLRRVDAPKEIEEMVARLKEEGERAWNSVHRYHKQVPHPGTEVLGTKKKSGGKKGGSSAPATPATGGAAPAAPADSGPKASAAPTVIDHFHRGGGNSTPAVRGYPAAPTVIEFEEIGDKTTAPYHSLKIYGTSNTGRMNRVGNTFVTSSRVYQNAQRTIFSQPVIQVRNISVIRGVVR